jgi:NAD(P)H-dependent FMN reductase
LLTGKQNGENQAMITIINGTNRTDSNTEKVAQLYVRLLEAKGLHPHYLSLAGLNVLERSDIIRQLEQTTLISSDKFIFVSPEYNGSYPGVLKAFIDSTDTRKVWPGKKALLTGVSTGRQGNMRGMDHLTSVLHHMQVHVHHNKLPISSVNKLMDDAGNITDAATLEAINKQLDEFIAF